MNNIDFNKLPIINAINNYLEEDIVPLSMPGHKYSKAFLNSEIENIILKGDITEVDGLDNLHSPEGIIKESEELLTKAYNSEKSYFLVNGSTSGNMIMIFAAFNEGDKVIVERNCHRSIMNGIILKKLIPIYVENIVHKELKCPIGVNKKHLEEIIYNNSDIKGIILTYPYYQGIGIGTEKIIKLCKENDLKVLIDSAHGAHFGFNKELSKSAQEFNADIVVMSAHKTLPSLTQTAYMHVNNKELINKVNFYKGMFLSTSPSYMFMMSLEYSRYFLETEGEEAYNRLLSRIESFRKRIKSLNFVSVIDKKYFSDYNDVEFDNSRIILHLREGLSGHKFSDYLRKNKVQCEMSDERNVILIPSPFNNENDFKRLSEVIINCDYSILEAEEKGFYESSIPTLVIPPFEAVERDSKIVSLEEAVGKIMGENIIPYPPGVPLLVMGELMEEKHLSLINKYIEDNVTLIGVDVEKKTVRVIK